jgi:predicted ATPase
MRLAAFSVTNYRSLTTAHRLPLADATVLLGQNNEGKSNLLSAIAAAMSVVTQLGQRRLIQGRLRAVARSSELYRWERDFPISLQDSQPDGESIFRLEFTLDDEERADFRKEVRSVLNENLPIEIRLGKRDPAFRVVKRGPGAEALNAKAAQIAEFIGRRVEFTYIPAVRTANAAIRVVRDMVERELRGLERDSAYTQLVHQLTEAQRPVLEAISRQIGAALKEFLPQIRSVDILASEDSRYRALRREVDIIVDDGTPTSLERKGDGVQSLAAISLLRGVTSSERDIILALEEPESHLHPSAIHRLREVIDELSHKHQTVITTHCPLFVDRSQIDSNIIVSGSKARPAKSIAEVRNVLGVRASDNLIHANWVVVVEGDTDARALHALLSHYSPVLRSALKNAHLVIDYLTGAGKLTYKLTELRNVLCGIHVFLDNDESGRSSAAKALEDGLLKPIDLQYASCIGKRNSEWEDLISVDLYESWVSSEYGVNLAGSPFQSARSWGDRMRETFGRASRDWTKKTEIAIKVKITELVEASPEQALNAHTRESFDNLRQALELKMATNLTRIAS